MFTYLFTLLMAFLVFYGGAGVNIVSFCCSECRSAGMEVLTGNKCCEIHGHSHDEVTIEAATAGISHSHEMCCNMHRISFDWDYEKTSIESPQPLVVDLFADGLPDLSNIILPIVSEVTSVMPTGPPLPPRVYLSLLTTLLI